MLVHEALERQRTEERKQVVIEEEERSFKEAKKAAEASIMKPTLQPYVRGKQPVQASPAKIVSKDEEGMRTLSRTTKNEQLLQQKGQIQIADYGKVELNKIQKDPYMASRNQTDNNEASDDDNEIEEGTQDQGVHVQVGIVQYEGAFSPRTLNVPAAGDFNAVGQKK